MLSFDPARLEWKFAALATFVVICVLVAGVAFGGSGIAGVLGFVLTVVAWQGEEDRTWYRLVAFGAMGTVVGLIAFLASDDVVTSSVLLGVVSYLATLAAFGSEGSRARWSLLVLWALIALIVADSEAALTAALGFAFGFSMAALLLRPTWGKLEHDGRRTAAGLRSAMTGETGRFALVKALAVGLAVPLGLALFPATPYWVALTVIIVGQAGRDDTTRLAVQRGMGTLLGVVLGVLVVWLVPAEGIWVPLALVLIVLCQMLFLNVNYVLYALFLTALIVVGSSMSAADVTDVGWFRLLATVVGALIAIGVVFVAGPARESPSRAQAG